VAMVFFCWQRCNHCCCLCWVLTFIRILHTSATSSYCGPVGNIEPSLQVKVDLRWVLSVFIENNLESYVCKLASLVWFFCCVAQNKHTTQPWDCSATQSWPGPLFCDTLTAFLTSTLSQLQAQSSEHERMKFWLQDPTNELTKKKLSKHSSLFLR
jgi:hypothetical protein